VVVQSLAIWLRKTRNGQGLKAKIRILCSLASPTTLMWLLNLRLKPRGFLCLMVCVLQLSMALIPPEIPRSKNQRL
jgi:hypothetical protein